jgi:hypothetical protein
MSETEMRKARLEFDSSSAWRPLSDVVSAVLRDVRIVEAPKVLRPVAATLN